LVNDRKEISSRARGGREKKPQPMERSEIERKNLPRIIPGVEKGKTDPELRITDNPGKTGLW